MSAKRPAVATAAHVVHSREAMTTNEGPTAVGAAAPPIGTWAELLAEVRAFEDWYGSRMGVNAWVGVDTISGFYGGWSVEGDPLHDEWDESEMTTASGDSPPKVIVDLIRIARSYRRRRDDERAEWAADDAELALAASAQPTPGAARATGGDDVSTHEDADGNSTFPGHRESATGTMNGDPEVLGAGAPLTADEERDLRGDLNVLGAKFALHERDVRRLLATLDAARDSRPVGEGLDVATAVALGSSVEMERLRRIEVAARALVAVLPERLSNMQAADLRLAIEEKT